MKEITSPRNLEYVHTGRKAVGRASIESMVDLGVDGGGNGGDQFNSLHFLYLAPSKLGVESRVADCTLTIVTPSIQGRPCLSICRRNSHCPPQSTAIGSLGYRDPKFCRQARAPASIYAHKLGDTPKYTAHWCAVRIGSAGKSRKTNHRSDRSIEFISYYTHKEI